MKKHIQQIKDLWSLFVGLFVTGDNLRKSTITVHYPRQEVDNLSSFRGPLMLNAKPKDPTIPKCISCMMCATTCPSGCITVVKHKAPKPTPEQEQAMAEAEARGEKVKKPKAPKHPKRFVYNYSLCSLCGLCTEACPANAIGFSNEAYMVCRDRNEMQLDLLARMQAQAVVPTENQQEVA